MGNSRSRTVQVLDLIEKYIDLLEKCQQSECYLINDKLIDIIHRRFFDDYYHITGVQLKAKEKDRDFSFFLNSNNTLMAYDAPVSVADWADTFEYLIGGPPAPYGYELNLSTLSLSTFTSSFLFFNESANSFKDFFLNVEQNIDTGELIEIPDFYRTMEEVYNCWESYPNDVEVYRNEMIPAARRCYKQHKSSQLFRKLFFYLNSICSLETDTLYSCYETQNCWYSIFYYGSYNDYEQGWYYLLPANLYLKRLYIDIALLELNRRYQFYSFSENTTTTEGVKMDGY